MKVKITGKTIGEIEELIWTYGEINMDFVGFDIVGNDVYMILKGGDKSEK